MNSRNKKIVIIFLLIIILTAISLNRYGYEFNSHYKNEILDEVYAENFNLNDELSYYSIISKNDENILLFWSTSCPHCEEVVNFIESNEIYSLIESNIFTVCISDNIEKVRSLDRKFSIYLDYNYSIFKKFDCEHVPTVFIVKSNGRIISKAEGSQESIQLVKEFIEKNGK